MEEPARNDPRHIKSIISAFVFSSFDPRNHFDPNTSEIIANFGRLNAPSRCYAPIINGCIDK